MSTKSNTRLQPLRVLLVAAVPAVLAIVPTAARAAITVTVASQGAAHDDFGTTLSGYTGYSLTVTADAGQVISGIDAGNSTTDAFGFFGPFLQDWIPGRGGATPTPIELTTTNGTVTPAGTNGSDFGTDTHFVIAATNQQASFAPTEDNNQTPPAGVTNTSQDDFGIGTYLHGNFGLIQSAQAPTVAVAYFVLPNGVAGTYNLDIAEQVPGSVTGSTDQVRAGAIGSATTVPEPTSLAALAVGAGGLLVGRRRAKRVA